MEENKMSLIDESQLTDEEIIKDISNKFIVNEGIGGYTLFEELNDRYRNNEEETVWFKNLWNKWRMMWKPYMCTQRRIDLQSEITGAVVKRYGKRYSHNLTKKQ